MIADGDGAGFQVMLAASAIDSAVPDCGTESERSGGSAQSEKELRGIERFQLVGLLKPVLSLANLGRRTSRPDPSRAQRIPPNETYDPPRKPR